MLQFAVLLRLSMELRALESFWERVRVAEGCWEWQGNKTELGYGLVSVRGERRMEKAHRVSWTLNRGPIPEGLWVLHRCDNPSCVKPSHLFLGTPADNTNDMLTKGREAKGTKSGTAKLREDSVRAIRAAAASGMRNGEIAKLFGVSPGTTCMIIKRQRWTHI